MSAALDTPAQEPEVEVNVLLVDDRPANLEALEVILRDTGYSLTSATSAEEGLRFLLQKDYACCLMDVRMPGMDGYEAARLIREDVELRHVPIIFVTAEASQQSEVNKGYASGAVDFLVKPLEPAIVRSKVKVFAELYLQRRKLERSAEIEALNSELAAANEALNSANQDLEHFAHISAHDLREPLRKQRNLIDLLIAELVGEQGRQATELLSLIADSAEQMLGMIDAFRALTKIAHGGLRRERVDLRELAEASVWGHEDALSDRHVVISYDPELATEEVYPSLASILFDNLIKNALDHVTRVGFEIAFTAQPDSASGITTYGVRNTGSSIPQQALKNVFKMFRKAGSGSSDGSGIGLSICKRVIDRHHGQIYAESGEDFVHIKFTFGAHHDH